VVRGPRRVRKTEGRKILKKEKKRLAKGGEKLNWGVPLKGREGNRSPRNRQGFLRSPRGETKREKESNKNSCSLRGETFSEIATRD